MAIRFFLINEVVLGDFCSIRDIKLGIGWSVVVVWDNIIW